MKRIIALLLVLLMAASVLAGCGAQSSQKDGSSAGQSDSNAETTPKEKVKVQHWEIEGKRNQVELIVQEYNKNSKDVEVVLTFNSIDGHKNNLKVAASSASLPDMWFNWGGSLASFYPNNNLTVDLTEIAEKEKWNEIYVGGMLDLCKFNGQLSGIPRHTYAMGIFYRKDIFEKYGLSEPETFKEFENVMATLKENNITPISTGGKFGWLVMRVLEAIIEKTAGTQLHDQLNALEAPWDSPEVIEAYSIFKEWNDKGYFPEGFITLDPTESKLPVYAGEAAMQLEGPWFDGGLITDQQDVNDYGFFPFPTDQEKVRLSGFTEMYQFNKASAGEVFDAALAYAKWSTDKETISEYSELLSHPTATIGAEMPDFMSNAKQLVDAMNEGGSYLITDQALPQEVIQKFFQAQDAIVTGGMTPEEAAKFMQDEVTKYKNK